jgi:hypothetical protein
MNEHLPRQLESFLGAANPLSLCQWRSRRIGPIVRPESY